jgi:hypothetical protein
MAALFAITMFIYMLPTYIAIRRHHPMLVGVGLVNFFFGETGVGWVGAILWALSQPAPRTPTYVERLEAEKGLEAEQIAKTEWEARHPGVVPPKC